jgi:hypothetical protein
MSPGTSSPWSTGEGWRFVLGSLVVVPWDQSWRIGRFKVEKEKFWVVKEERNKGKVVDKRKNKGSEFQTVGAAKEKERQPLADRMSGTVRRDLSADLRFRVGTQGVMISSR